ncbi:MAG: AAA family ATPase [Candidatus Heimdallarchaeaceae archaeon]
MEEFDLSELEGDSEQPGYLRNLQEFLKGNPLIEPIKPKKVTSEDIYIPEEISDEIEKIVLGIQNRELFGEEMGLSGILFYGPPGGGKTLTALYLANKLDANLFVIETLPIRGGETFVHEIFETARKYSKETERPSMILIDEAEKYFPKRDEVADITDVRVTSQFLSEMDGLHSNSGIFVVALTNLPDMLDPALRRYGRFDKELEILPPGEDGRKKIINIHLKKEHNFELTKEDIDWLAKNAYGYTGGDLKGVLKEAFLEANKRVVKTDIKKIVVKRSELQKALDITSPSGLRGFYFKKPEKTFADLPGLEDIQQKLTENIIDAIKHSNEYEEMKICTEGILLYGPAGTGKTCLMEAVAHESGANFMFIRGPELHHWLFGKSEDIIRKIFKKAKNAAPTIVGLDEIDSLASVRGVYSTPTDSIVGQLLSQLGDTKNVYVIATTNRLDKVDPALLRSGRIGIHLEVGLPNLDAGTKIWNYYISQVPKKYGIDTIRNSIEELANFSAERLSGADIEQIVTSYIKIPLIHGKKVTLEDVKDGISEHIQKTRRVKMYGKD